MVTADDLIAHLEGELGTIDGGWAKNAVGEPLLFQVVRFLDMPMAEAVTYSTLGLSDAELSLPSGKRVRQELLFVSHRTGPAAGVGPAVLDVVGGDMLRSGKAVARGDVIGPAGPLFTGGNLTALYCSVPVVFSGSFHVWNGSAPPTVFVWLIPITTAEAGLVRDHGWSKFEDGCSSFRGT